MTDSQEKVQIEVDSGIVENGSSSNGLDDVNSPEYKRLTRRVLWKLDIHVLPALALLWLANFIDRSNIGNAKIAGLATDTHLRGNQFNSCLAILYAGYIVSELPSNWVVKRVKPNIWLPFIVGAWGLTTVLTGIVHNFGGLFTIRLMLGFCEGGLLPGMVLYLSTLYKRHELQLRIGLFYASSSLSGAFGGLLATAILKMDGVGGLAGWRWIFILEGIATILLGLFASWMMPTDLASAPFFTPEEKEHAIKRYRAHDIAASRIPRAAVASPAPTSIPEKSEIGYTERVNEDNASAENLDYHEEKFEWYEIRRGLVDIQTWLTGIAYFGLIVSLYSYSLFLPTIVVGLGYSGSAAQLHTVPPYVPAAVLTVVVAYFADRLKWRGPFILICLPITIVGYIIAITAKTNTARYAAVFLMAAGAYPSGPCILSILPNNSSGHYKRATTTALQLMIANTGGFVATFAYTADQAPRYIRGHTIALACVCMAWVFVFANVVYCTWENKARKAGRRQGNVDKYRALWDSGKTRAPIGDRSPEFLFTL